VTQQQMQTQAGVPQPLGLQNPAGQSAQGGAMQQQPLPQNPYAKTPLLTRRRRFPSFY
jgi:hypothetical protein